jgi:hypothetical protein
MNVRLSVNDESYGTRENPNSKHQITNKRQGPIRQTTNACGWTEVLAVVWLFWRLIFVVCLILDAWCLEFLIAGQSSG